MSRYIDADALKEHIEVITYEGMWHTSETDEFVSVENIENAPTIDAVSVVHGEWIDSTKQTWTPSIKCSNCGAMFHEVAQDLIAKYGFNVANDWNFCPNCGARMKGADDGDNNQML